MGQSEAIHEFASIVSQGPNAGDNGSPWGPGEIFVRLGQRIKSRGTWVLGNQIIKSVLINQALSKRPCAKFSKFVNEAHDYGG